MRQIEIEDGLRLRFPHRDAAFAEGVEIGVLAVRLAAGPREVTSRISPASLEQARDLAQGLGYRALKTAEGGDWIDVSFTPVHARPRLRLVLAG
jgi:hypothetical protein